MQSVKSQLDRLTTNISETMNKITNREKFLNSNLDSLLTEYRSVHVSIEIIRRVAISNVIQFVLVSQEQYSKVNNRYRELNSGVIERQRKLTRITEELESVKQEMEERGTIMSDGSERSLNIAFVSLIT